MSFSDGSTRTPENLRDCAEQIATHDCDAWNIDVLPECVTPGTRGPGEACLFASQCQSLACSSSGESCGVCLRFATDADDCNDSSVFTCEPGYTCDPGTGLCQPRTPPVIEPASSEPKGDPTADMRGAPCTRDSDCGAYEACMESGDEGALLCGRDPILGEDCREARNCDDKQVSYCELDGLTCLALPKLGQRCGVDGWTGGAGWCEPGTACERTSEMEGTCVLLPALGEPCFFLKFPDSELGHCATGLTCSENTTCVSKPEPVDTISPVGGSCTDATAECHPASRCTNGVCEPIDSQGLFDGSCRPVQ